MSLSQKSCAACCHWSHDGICSFGKCPTHALYFCTAWATGADRSPPRPEEAKPDEPAEGDKSLARRVLNLEGKLLHFQQVLQRLEKLVEEPAPKAGSPIPAQEAPPLLRPLDIPVEWADYNPQTGVFKLRFRK